jgi:hypothetical protein
MADEKDLRLEILNTLLTTPHRELAAIWPIHSDMVARDPRFYVQLAAWYLDQGAVRDHKEMFVVNLVLSEFPGHRDVGLAMIRQMPPYQLARVVDFIHGRKTTRLVEIDAGKAGRRHRARQQAGTAGEGPPTAQVKKTEEFGLFKNVPRSLKTEVERYLREREADPDWFDSSVLMAKKAIKRLYAVLHIRPTERAQKILFDREPPADSRLHALKVLAAAESPADQARAIVEHSIPYRVAATVVKQMTPTVLAALVDRMSPQDLINNLAALKRRGAMDNPSLKMLIDEKLAAAKTDKRVSAFKAAEAIQAAGASDELRAQLEAVSDQQIKAKGRIQRPTALLIDKSASMESAIELGKRIGAMISTVCEQDLFVYAFDDIPYPIERAGESLADWERAMAGIRAGNSTSCGVALEHMARRKQFVEQVILITDEEENTAPYFVPALVAYRAALSADPTVCIVRTVGGSRKVEEACRAAGIAVDVFQFTGDYYALPNLIPILAQPSKMELLMEILQYPLPRRKEG